MNMWRLKVRAEAQCKFRFKKYLNININKIIVMFLLIFIVSVQSTANPQDEEAVSLNSHHVTDAIHTNMTLSTNDRVEPNVPHNSAQKSDESYDTKNHYDSSDNIYDLPNGPYGGHNSNGNTDYDSIHTYGINAQIPNNMNNPFTAYGGNNINNAYVNSRQFNLNSNSKTRLSNRIVETRYGRLQGILMSMEDHKFLKPVEVFLGVPYATPPVGSNRFSPTRTPSPWDGIRISDTAGPACPQKLPDIKNESAALERMPKGRLEYLKRLLPYLRNQSEDCLYMNIYTPAQDGQRDVKHPVLMYIHGESFEWNSGNPYDGSVLASYADMVVITINYRLGLFGFLNANPTPHLKARVANYGLMDQIAALHWVQQNIELFGGDKSSVTLLGHGSGAACINFLMISPTVVPGLFHRAVLLSGSALSSWALVEDPVNYSVRLAREVNCTIPADLAKDHEQIVDCLRDSPIEELLEADVTAPNYLSAFGPSVDGVVIKTDYAKEFLTYFIPNDMQNYAPSDSGQNYNSHMKRSDRSSGRNMQNRYDLLFGVVTSEALWKFSAQDIQNGFEADRRDRILRTYVRNAYTYHLSEIFFTVVNEYTDWERTVQQHPINMRDATVAALSDAQYVAPLVQTADLLSGGASGNGGGSTGNPPDSAAPTGPSTYFYVFDYQTKDGDYPQRMGTVHGEELPYLFGAPLVEGFNHFPKNYTKSEVALSEAFILYMANFARSGNPNEHFRQDSILAASKERNRFRSITWDEYDSVHQKYLEIGMKPRMKNHFRAHQLSVWLRLVPELHRAGMEDVVARHNLFRNHNDADLYDGVVRPDPLSRAMPYETSTDIFRRQQVTTNNTLFVDVSLTTIDTVVTTCVTSLPGSPVATTSNATNDPLASLEAAGYAAYSTALSVTIAIGCSLLILNVLIFAGVYYQRDKTRLDAKNMQHYNTKSFDSLSGKHSHYHIEHSQNASVIVDVETQGLKHAKNKKNSNMQQHADALLGDVNFKGTHLCGNSTMQINSGALVKGPPASPSVMMGNSMTLPHKNRGIQKNINQNIGTLPKNPAMHYQQQQHLMNTSNMIAEMHHQGILLPPNGSATMHLSMPSSPPTHRRPDSPPMTQNLRATHGTFKSNMNSGQNGDKQNTLPQAAMSEMRV